MNSNVQWGGRPPSPESCSLEYQENFTMNWKIASFLSIFSYFEGTLLLIVSYFKVPNSSIFHSIISADRAFIVDILLNRADSELVILSWPKKGNQNAKYKKTPLTLSTLILKAESQHNFPLEPSWGWEGFDN